MTAFPSRHKAPAGIVAVFGYVLGGALACDSQVKEAVHRPMPPVAAKYFDEVVRIADTHAERCRSLYAPESGCRAYLTAPGDAGPAPEVPVDSPILETAPELVALEVSCSWAAPPPSSPPPPPVVVAPEDPPIGALCRFKPLGHLPVPYGANCHVRKPYSPEWTGAMHQPSENVLVPFEEACDSPWVGIEVNRGLGRPGALVRVKAVFRPG